MITPLYGSLTALGRSYGTAAAAAFTPSSISGLVGWYRADQGLYQASTGTGSLAATAGDVVGYWADQSTSANHSSQSTSGNKPTIGATLNGLPTVNFNGSQWTNLTSGMTMAVAGDYTIYYVGLTPPINSQSWVSLFSRVDKSMFGKYNQDGPVAVDSGSVNFVGVSGAAFPSAAGVGVAARARHIASGTFWKWKNNGLAEGSGVSSAMGDLTFTCIGTGLGSAGGTAQGNVGEILVFNRALTTPEQTNVETYITGRWGVSV
jgi:hypothetical protein